MPTTRRPLAPLPASYWANIPGRCPSEAVNCYHIFKPWDIVTSALAILGISFHCLVFYFILRQALQRHPHLSSPFYRIYLVLAATEIVNSLEGKQVHVREQRRLQNVWSFGAAQWKSSYGFFMDFFEGNNALAHFDMLFTAYLTNVQWFAHCLIAMNRFTVFAFPMSHQKIWKRKTITLAFAALATLPLPLVLVYVPAEAVFIYIGPNSLTNMFVEERWRFIGGLIYGSTCLCTSLISATLEIAGLIAFKRYVKKFQISEEHRKNLRLLGEREHSDVDSIDLLLLAMTSEQSYKDALIANLEQSQKLARDIDVSKCVILAISPPEEQLAQAEARIEQIDAFVSKINSLANEIAYNSDSYAAWAETVLDPDEREAVNRRYFSLTEQKLDHLAALNERSKKVRREKASYQKLIASLSDRLQPQQPVDAQLDQKPVPTSWAGAPPQGENRPTNDGQQFVARRSGALHPPLWGGGQYNRPTNDGQQFVAQRSDTYTLHPPYWSGGQYNTNVGGPSQVPMVSPIFMDFALAQQSKGHVLPEPRQPQATAGTEGPKTSEPTAPPLETGPSIPGSYLAANMLPKLTLPTFDGNISDWPTFWQSFEAAVGAAPIPPIQKLTLLMSNLTGAARKEVAGYAVTNDNYNVVKQVLVERFGNQDQILNNLMTQLVQVPAAQGSIQSLKNTMSEIERICRQLECQGLDINNRHVLVTIEAKLPKWIIRVLYCMREAYNMPYDVNMLRNIVRAKLRAREHTEMMCGSLESQKRDKKPQKKEAKDAHLFTTQSKPGHKVDQPTPKCRFCNQGHWATDCFTYPDAGKRKAMAKELSLCLKCLGNRHTVQQCKRTKACFYCGSKAHHGALCDANASEGKPWKVEVVPEQGRGHANNAKVLAITSTQNGHANHANVRAANDPKPEQAIVPTCLTCAAHEKRVKPITQQPPSKWFMVMTPCTEPDVVMLTRRATVYNSDDASLREQAVLFFDSGSTSPYITRRLAESLGLRSKRTDECRIATYRDTDPEPQRLPIYKASVVLTNGSSMMLELAGVDSLPAIDTAHIQTMPDDPHQGISLELGQREPGILIGQQHLSAFDIKRIYLLKGGGEIFATAVGAAMSGPLATSATDRQATRNEVITTLINSTEDADKSADKVNLQTETNNRPSVEVEDQHPHNDVGLDQPNSDFYKEVAHYTAKWPVGGVSQDLPRSRTVYRRRPTAPPDTPEGDSLKAGGDGPDSSEPTVDKSNLGSERVKPSGKGSTVLTTACFISILWCLITSTTGQPALPVCEYPSRWNLTDNVLAHNWYCENGSFRPKIATMCTQGQDAELQAGQSCLGAGLFIFRNKTTNNFCTAFQRCSDPHSHTVFLNTSVVCGVKCTCPSWSSDCSFHDPLNDMEFYPQKSSEPKLIRDLAEQIQLINELRPDECRIQGEPITPENRNCTKAFHTRLHVVQLDNGQQFYVKELHVHKKELVQTRQRCLGYQLPMLSNRPTRGISSANLPQCIGDPKRCAGEQSKICWSPITELATLVVKNV